MFKITATALDHNNARVDATNYAALPGDVLGKVYATEADAEAVLDGLDLDEGVEAEVTALSAREIADLA